MTKAQAQALLELIADLYAILSQPPPQGEQSDLSTQES